jgi:small-conductance mechanosensitive channel
MRDSRRQVLINLFGTAAALAASQLAFAQARTSSPQPLPSPNAPDPHNPGGLDGMQATKDSPATKAANQKQIREDVAKLYEMVSALKQQVETTDLNSTLPVTVVKQAQQIEKLAKQIKEHAKG